MNLGLKALCLSIAMLATGLGCALPMRTVAGAQGQSHSMGAKLTSNGAFFRVWAPDATAVSVKGLSTSWPVTQLSTETSDREVWYAYIANVHAGDRYLYSITSASGQIDKVDPESQQTDQDWSVVVDPHSYVWNDQNFHRAPLNEAVIYELHVGSFNQGINNSWGNFSSTAEKFDYLSHLGINYIELLPVHQSARPFDWGYGPSLPNAIENNYGSPEDFRHFVDLAHQHGIGVLVDVVHNHYSSQSVLKCFDGNCNGANGQYFYTNEYASTPWGPRPNYAEPHVRSFISGNIDQYIKEYHVDGFRWDSTENIAEITELDPVTKKPKLTKPNTDGVSLLQQVNQVTHQSGAVSIAEYWGAPTSATQAVSEGGIGFNSHWTGFFPVVQAVTAASTDQIKMSRVADALRGDLKRVIFTESHDEVGHPPKQIRIPARIDSQNPESLLSRKRSLVGAVLVMTSPGIPMIFQGQEFLETQSFSFPTGTLLNWELVHSQAGIVRAYHYLIALRRNFNGKALALLGSGIEIFHQNNQAKVLAFRRFDQKTAHQIVVLVNLGPKSFAGYKIGLPSAGTWSVVFSSDDKAYSPDFMGSPSVRTINATNSSCDNFPQSASIELAPFTAVILVN